MIGFYNPDELSGRFTIECFDDRFVYTIRLRKGFFPIQKIRRFQELRCSCYKKGLGICAESSSLLTWKTLDV